jgi:hypothetical protein
VIAIEGSLSENDCFTDAIAHSVESAEAKEASRFDMSGTYAHAGFLTAALSVREGFGDCQRLSE